MTNIVGLAGDRVRLVPPDRAAHFDNALQWINDPAVNATTARNWGASPAEERAFFDRIEADRDTMLTWAIHAEDGRHVGFIDLRDISWRFRLATGGLMIGDRSAWGRGYATDAVRVRTRFAFDDLGLHRIEGHTFNPVMRRVYEKCGYTLEGVARQKLWRGGRWHDAACYAILDTDPPAPA